MVVTSGINVSEAYALLGVLLALSWVFFGLRAFVRLWIIKKPGMDDLLLLIAILCYTVFTGFACDLVANGLGSEIDNSLEPSVQLVYSKATKDWFFAELFFILTSTVLRIACGVTLLRIITVKNKMYKYIIIVVITIMAVFSVSFFMISLFQCQPVSYFWMNQLVPKASGHCINNEFLDTPYRTMASFYIAHSVISALTDWILGVLPFFIIRSIHMSKWKKGTVTVLLGLGIVAGVTAIIRIPLIIDATMNQFWNGAIPMAITTALEPALGLIALSSATLLPLFKKGLRRIDSRDGNSTGQGKESASRGSHRMTIMDTQNRSKDMNSKTAIVVETSWIVEDEIETNSHRNNSDDEMRPSHKVTIGV